MFLLHRVVRMSGTLQLSLIGTHAMMLGWL
jgi:hypothetical protein